MRFFWPPLSSQSRPTGANPQHLQRRYCEEEAIHRSLVGLAILSPSLWSLSGSARFQRHLGRIGLCQCLLGLFLLVRAQLVEL